MNLNRKNLRHLILEEMSKLIREQDNSGWEDIDLKGVVAQGRPALEGEYTVISDGSYSELGDQVKFRVTSYQDDPNHDAVGNEFTLAQMQANEIKHGGASTYQGHPLWDKLVAAAKQEVEDWQSSVGDAEEEVEADDLALLSRTRNSLEDLRPGLDDIAARLQQASDAEAQELEDEAEALISTLADQEEAQGAFNRIFGTGDKTLRERDVPVSVITLDGEDNARTRRFKRRLERDLSDFALTMPVGVHTVFNVDWSEDGRISTSVDRNEVNPRSLPAEYTDPDNRLYLSGGPNEDVRVEDLGPDELVRWISDRVTNSEVSREGRNEFYGVVDSVLGGLRSDSRNARAMKDLSGITVSFYADEEGAAEETQAQAWLGAAEDEDTDLALTR